MSLLQWLENGWLQSHKTSAQEIASLMAIVNRDLTDARSNISLDWQFGIAYNAALKLCTILLYAEGYRPERTLQHYRTIQALSFILGEKHNPDVEYLEVCRKKRNTAEYDYVGSVTDSDAEELISFTEELKDNVLKWLREHYPQFLSS